MTKLEKRVHKHFPDIAAEKAIAVEEVEINQSNVLDYIIQYEEGELPYPEYIQLFQFLVDSGMAWTLQGRFGREAMYLIEQGALTVPIRRVSDE